MTEDGSGEKNNLFVLEIIKHKKLGMELTKDEIVTFVKGVSDGSIPNYQISALLMAIRLNGMTDNETAILTKEMRDSGKVIDFSYLDGYIADKHSTGGVGDDTSLIIAPLVSACGVKVPMMSGRGLGHTGGTLDKWESIPGFNVNLSEKDFKKQIEEIGVAIIGQTEDIAPADKVLYSLRDVTSTVDSLPLITGSIMSKKLASGTNNLVLDVKTGSGAVIKNIDDSIELAKLMLKACKEENVNAVAYVTDMNEPLGTYIGNALAIKNVINILNGKEQDNDLLELSLTLGGQMLVLNNIVNNVEDGKKLLQEKIDNGEGIKKFKELIKAQGGNENVCDDVSLLPQAKYVKEVKCKKNGYIQKIDTEALGYVSVLLGAGRTKADDKIDYSVGFVFPYKIGDYIEENNTICTIYSNDEKNIEKVATKVLDAISFSDTKVEKRQLIYKKILEENSLLENK